MGDAGQRPGDLRSVEDGACVVRSPGSGHLGDPPSPPHRTVLKDSVCARPYPTPRGRPRGAPRSETDHAPRPVSATARDVGPRRPRGCTDRRRHARCAPDRRRHAGRTRTGSPERPMEPSGAGRVTLRNITRGVGTCDARAGNGDRRRDTSLMTTDYARALGARLRAIRPAAGPVAARRRGEVRRAAGRRSWSGSYERGDRAVTVQKLAELADFYAVPVSELLPGRVAGGASRAAPAPRHRPRAARPGARGEGRPAGALRRRHPRPARRLQRPGPVDPPGRPAHPGGHLRPGTRACSSSSSSPGACSTPTPAAPSTDCTPDVDAAPAHRAAPSVGTARCRWGSGVAHPVHAHRRWSSRGCPAARPR